MSGRPVIINPGSLEMTACVVLGFILYDFENYTSHILIFLDNIVFYIVFRYKLCGPYLPLLGAVMLKNLARAYRIILHQGNFTVWR